LLDQKDYIKARKEAAIHDDENHNEEDIDYDDEKDVYDDDDKDLEEYDKEKLKEHVYFDAD